MKICATIEELQELLAPYRKQKRSIGFVPTMGALHKGHLSLISASMAENEVTVCSIFVNPTQFNNATDLERYPRTADDDKKLLAGAQCDILFIPAVSEMYRSGDYSLIQDDFGALDKVMEGKSRPGHFAGMLTIVNKLFAAVMPDKAYFGEKDYQQLALVKQFVARHHIPVTVIACPIVREEGGLAMSSRNRLLSSEEKKHAVKISQALFMVKAQWGARPVSELKQMVKEIFANDAFLKLDYFEIVNSFTLAELHDPDADNEPAVACIAAYCGTVRLIDNVLLQE